MRVFAAVSLVLGLALLMARPGYADGPDTDETGSSDLCPDANTQFELNACAGKAFEEEDKELNRVYQEIIKKYGPDRVFIRKFRSAQRAWLKFRDAQFEARFPEPLDRQGQWNYGSIFPMCASLYKATLTHSRVEELRVWLDGMEEGDVCSSSLPTGEE